MASTSNANANPRPSAPRPQSDMDKLMRELSSDAGRSGVTGEGVNTGPIMHDPGFYLSDLLANKMLGEPLESSRLAIMMAGLMGMNPNPPTGEELDDERGFAPPATPKLANPHIG